VVIDWEKRHDRSLFYTFTQMLRHKIVFMADIREILHLALVGGGMKPEEATVMVRTWVELRPLDEVQPTALQVMDVFFFGSEEYRAARNEANEARAKFLAEMVPEAV
jgi:hypothetical protein